MATAFRITVWLGVLVNLVLATAAVAAPDQLLDALGFDVAYPNLWPRFAGWLLILLSLFYLPGANDPHRYRANAVLSVAARFSGVAFFAGAAYLLGFERRYLLFALIDLVFGAPALLFLVLAVRRHRLDAARDRALAASLLPTPAEPHGEPAKAVPSAR